MIARAHAPGTGDTPRARAARTRSRNSPPAGAGAARNRTGSGERSSSGSIRLRRVDRKTQPLTQDLQIALPRRRRLDPDPPERGLRIEGNPGLELLEHVDQVQ